MTKTEFINLIEDSLLSEEEKQIARMIYIEHKDMRLIADTIGYCEKTIQRKHKKIKKILGYNKV